MHETYLRLPLLLELDWTSPEGRELVAAGVDPWEALDIAYVDAGGEIYRDMNDYSVSVEDELYLIGPVDSQTHRIEASVLVSIGRDHVAGGSWVVKDAAGNEVALALR